MTLFSLSLSTHALSSSLHRFTNFWDSPLQVDKIDLLSMEFVKFDQHFEIEKIIQRSELMFCWWLKKELLEIEPKFFNSAGILRYIFPNTVPPPLKIIFWVLPLWCASLNFFNFYYSWNNKIFKNAPK